MHGGHRSLVLVVGVVFIAFLRVFVFTLLFFVMVRCGGCRWACEISQKLRWGLSQENKEILNVLEKRGFDLNEFCYCERQGFLESVILERNCKIWEPRLENNQEM